MERNTILAIVLCTAYLFIYNSFFMPHKQAGMAKNTQSTAAQTLNQETIPSTIAAPASSEKTTNPVINAIDYDFKTTQSDISYINVGGSLHKIDFFKNLNSANYMEEESSLPSVHTDFPITGVLDINGFENVPFAGQKIDDHTVSFTYRDKNWKITKTYQINDANYITVRMEIKNVSEMSILNNLVINALNIDVSRMEINQSNRETSLYEYSVYADNKIARKGSAYKFNVKNDKVALATVKWIGFRDHFHAFIVKPEFQTKSFEIKTLNDKQLSITLAPEDKSLAPGESVIYDFSIYEGPQNPWAMKKYQKGFEKIVAFSNFLIIEWIGQAIFHIIPVLHNIFFHSWGIAIILISLMIYGITYPLTMQSMLSMRKMQEVQPKIAALKDKYKNDPQKLNAEMIEIYRREKINPLGGCLPILIQMPFFMALYQILWRAEYFQGQSFLWIKDLAQPDRLFILPFNLPLFGNELNILPLLTAVMMFLQQKVSAKNMIVTDEQQVMQQKMMMYFVPLMMTWMFYHFASSWAIYFLIFYICSTATQMKIAKMGKLKESA